MPAEPLTSDDYPYEPHTAAAHAAEKMLRQSYSPFFWRWVQRCFISSAALMIFALGVFGFLAYRVASQSLLVAELERLGCSVRYENEPVVEDAWPEYFRRWFGDHWWSDVHEVS